MGRIPAFGDHLWDIVGWRRSVGQDASMATQREATIKDMG